MTFRRRLALLVANGLTKADLLRQLGKQLGKDTLNGNSYARFMSFKGPFEGQTNIVYQAAQLLFACDDTDTVQVASAAAAGTGVATAASAVAPSVSSASVPSPAAPSRKEAAAAFQLLKQQLAAIDLPEEDESSWSQQPNCTTIRRRINEFLLSTGTSQSDFLSHLCVNSKSFGCFMSYTGKWQGSDNGTFSAARTFFAQLDLHHKVAKKGRKLPLAASASGPAAKKAKVSQYDEE